MYASGEICSHFIDMTASHEYCINMTNIHMLEGDVGQTRRDQTARCTAGPSCRQCLQISNERQHS